jgi:hypothetical protein
MPTILIGELDTDDRILPSIAPCGPRGTDLAQRTGNLLCFPIDVKLTHIIGLLILRLPRAIGEAWPNQCEAELLRALYQEGRIHIMFAGAMLFVTQGALDRGRRRDIGDSPRGHFHVRNDMEHVVITRLGDVHFVPSPRYAAFCPEVRLRVIGRVHTQPGWGQVLRLAPAEVATLISIVVIHSGLP